MTDHPKRIANLFNVTPELLREFLAHLSKPDDGFTPMAELVQRSRAGYRWRQNVFKLRLR
jgi:hypothetical protein